MKTFHSIHFEAVLNHMGSVIVDYYLKGRLFIIQKFIIEMICDFYTKTMWH